jgi:hypothetical protein
MEREEFLLATPFAGPSSTMSGRYPSYIIKKRRPGGRLFAGPTCVLRR